MATTEQLMDKLNSNIESLRSSVYPKTPISDSQITQNLFLSDRQIVKNIISKKSPDLDERSLNLIVYGRDLEKELGPSYIRGYSDNENIFPNSVNDDDNADFKPLPPDDPNFDEVNKLKNEFRDAMQTLQSKLATMLQELTTTTVFVTNSIPTMAILVAPPSFNVSGAISIAMLTINSLSSLKTQFREVLPFLDVLKNADILIKEDKLQGVIGTLNNAIIGPLAEISEKLNVLSNLGGKNQEKQEYLEKANKEMNDLDSQIERLDPNADDYNTRLSDLESQKEELAARIENEIKK